MLCIALIGFGEAGVILANDLAAAGCRVRAYDRLLQEPRYAAALADKARLNGVEPMQSAADASQDAELVISAVTASAAFEVSEQLAPHLRPGQYYLDLNSVAPDTKRACANCVEASGAYYIDCAVMGPFPPTRLRTPMLLSGGQAADLAEQLTETGFNVRVVGETVGIASAIKMCRSVIIKGLEALTAECLRGARRYGAEDQVLASLSETFPDMGWEDDQPDYLISRVAEHGRRRSEEMQEVCRTLADVGLNPRMSQAVAQTQLALVESMAVHGVDYFKPFDWRSWVDRISD